MKKSTKKAAKTARTKRLTAAPKATTKKEAAEAIIKKVKPKKKAAARRPKKVAAPKPPTATKKLARRVGAPIRAAVPATPAFGTIDAPIDCLVIGAGMAGLKAADILARKYGRSVTIVESSNRVGGRAHTIHDPKFGIPIELGAELLHVPADHEVDYENRVGPQPTPPARIPIWDDVESAPRLATIDVKKDNIFGSDASVRLYYEHLCKKDGPVTGVTAFALSHGFRKGVPRLGYAMKYRRRDPNALDQSVEEFMLDDFGHPWPDDPEDAVARATVDMLLGSTASGPLDELSISGLQYDMLENMLDSDEEYHVVDGMSALAEKILGQTAIAFEHKVIEVEWKRPRVVRVACKTRLGAIVEIFAQSVVVTLPLGVLKSGTVDFDPMFFTDVKKRAVDNMKVETLSKLSMSFRTPFWNQDTAIFTVPEPKKKAASVYFVPQFGRQKRHDILTGLFTRKEAAMLDRYMRGASMLSADLPSGDIADVERFIEDSVFADLRAMYPKTFPKNATVASTLNHWAARSWTNDPHACGGTSYIVDRGLSRAAVHALRRQLAAPTPPVFWAGEATALALHPWSLHGAHESGMRAAEETQRYLST